MPNTAPLPLGRPMATADRPLTGQTVLLVEDSRFASDAIRLICQRLGARLRRADSIAAAHRHLLCYRPTLMIVDIGLPDGDGAALIRDLGRRADGPAILAISGDPGTEAAARDAGAGAFAAKPIASIAAFRQIALALLPDAASPMGPAAVPTGEVRPDRATLREDYEAAARLIAGDPLDAASRSYALRFLTGVAETAGDRRLAEAARAALLAGPPRQIAALIADRVAGLPAAAKAP